MKKQYKIPYILGALFFFILGVVLSNTYRPYIYTNHIYDYHFADTIETVAGAVYACYECGKATGEFIAEITK